MKWLFFGYLAAWLVHLGYLLSITVRQQRLNRDLEGLRKLIETRGR